MFMQRTKQMWIDIHDEREEERERKYWQKKETQPVKKAKPAITPDTGINLPDLESKEEPKTPSKQDTTPDEHKTEISERKRLDKLIDEIYKLENEGKISKTEGKKRRAELRNEKRENTHQQPTAITKPSSPEVLMKDNPLE